jgi:hypothetical protein
MLRWLIGTAVMLVMATSAGLVSGQQTSPDITKLVSIVDSENRWLLRYAALDPKTKMDLEKSAIEHAVERRRALHV